MKVRPAAYAGPDRTVDGNGQNGDFIPQKPKVASENPAEHPDTHQDPKTVAGPVRQMPEQDNRDGTKHVRHRREHARLRIAESEAFQDL